MNKITTNLDVRTIHDGQLWPHFTNKRNQAWHLRIICGQCQLDLNREVWAG